MCVDAIFDRVHVGIYNYSVSVKYVSHISLSSEALLLRSVLLIAPDLLQAFSPFIILVKRKLRISCLGITFGLGIKGPNSESSVLYAQATL